MLYHNFDKFKREATQLKKLLREANPHSSISLTQCQNWIAASVPDVQDFNSLYLTHQSFHSAIRKDVQPHFVLTSKYPVMDEWFEFAQFPAQRDWINLRHNRMMHILMKERHIISPSCIDGTLQTLWTHHVCNQHLGDALINKKAASLSMFSEKEWRNGILLGGKSERKYLRFLEGCLPKLARDGGILTLSLPQARAFQKMWSTFVGDVRVPLRIFDLDTSRKTLRSTALQKHTYWPTFNFKPDRPGFDAEFRALRSFQNSSAISMATDGLLRQRGDTFLATYLEICGLCFNPAIRPDIPMLLKMVQDQELPLFPRLRLAAYLSSLNVEADLDPESTDLIQRISIEQHNHLCPQALSWTDTFTHEQDVSARITLADWAASPGVSVFILPEKPGAKDVEMMEGMLAVLCTHQIKQALTSTISSLSKGLWLPASPAVTQTLPAEMRRPPAALRHHTLWGWARIAEDAEFSYSDDSFDFPQDASEHEGTSVWLAGMPHSTPWSRGFCVFSRLQSGTGTTGMYLPWKHAMSGTLLIS